MTDKEIFKLKPTAKTQRICIIDDLYIHISPKGKKVFALRLREQNTTKTIGEFKANFGISEALAIKSELLKSLKAQENSGGFATISELFEAFLHTKENAVTQKTYERYINSYNKSLKQFASRTLESLQAFELIEAIKMLNAEQETPYRALSLIRAMYEFAICNGANVVNPIASIRPSVLLGKREKRNHPTLTQPEDLSRLFTAIKNSASNPLYKFALIFQALTALRSQNIRKLEWAQIAGDGLLCISAEAMKMRKPFYLPLSTQAQKILQKLELFKSHERYVFPARNSRGVISDDTLRMLLRRAGISKEEFTPHGFRAMFSTLANEHNFSSEIIELCLAHTTQGVRGVYDRSHRIEAKRELMQWWGDYLQEFIADFL